MNEFDKELERVITSTQLTTDEQLQAIKQQINKARLEENKRLMEAGRYEDDTYSIRSDYFNRRIQELQKITLYKPQPTCYHKHN